MFEYDAIAAWFSVIDYFVGSLLFLHMFIISLYKQPSLNLCVHNLGMLHCVITNKTIDYAQLCNIENIRARPIYRQADIMHFSNLLTN